MSILTLWKGIFPSYTAGHPFLGRNVPRLSPDYPLGGHNVPWLLRTPPDPKRRTPPFSTPLGPKRSSNMRRS